MCCLSEASSHFVVFVCVNPDRERLPSIESPKQKSLMRLLGLRPHEVWLRLGIVQTSLFLHSARTEIPNF